MPTKKIRETMAQELIDEKLHENIDSGASKPDIGSKRNFSVNSNQV